MNDPSHLFKASGIKLRLSITFIPPCKDNLQGHVFLWRINLLFLLLTKFTFLKLIYSQNDKIGVFTGSRSQNSLHYPTMVGRLLKNFFIFFSMDFTHCWWYLCKTVKENKYSKFILLLLVGFLKISNRKEEIIKSTT